MTNIFANHESDLAVVADLARPDVLKFGDNGIAYNGNIELDKIDKFLNARTRQYGTFATDDLPSFADFIETHGTLEDTSIFIDKTAMKCEAVLNFGDKNQPMGHCDFRAVLTSEPTKVCQKIISMHNAGRISQKEFAVFLEDWARVIVAYEENGQQIPIKKAIAVIRDMKIDEMAESTSQVANFRESRSRLESVAVKSQVGVLPAYFEIKDRLYQTLAKPKTVKLRLAISTANGKPEFSLSAVGYELLADELANDFLQAVKDKLDSEFCLFFGKFQG